MGKQVLIYALPNDLEELEPELRRRAGDFVTVNSRSAGHTVEPAAFQSPSEEPAGASLWVCLVRREDVSDLVLKHVASQSYWSIDILRSPVVEFRRCYFDGKTLREGRLFFESGYYQDAKWRDKPEPFLKWAGVVLKTTRSLFRRDPSLNAYVGPHAEKWRKRFDGKFVWK